MRESVSRFTSQDPWPYGVWLARARFARHFFARNFDVKTFTTVIVATLLVFSARTGLPQPPVELDAAGSPPAHRHERVEIDGRPVISRVKIALERPRRLLFDPAGNLLIADSGSGKILRLSPEGKVEVVADELVEPSGLALDGRGNLYVSDHAEGGEDRGAIVRITPDGKRTVFAGGLTAPKGLAVDAEDRVYAAGFKTNVVWRIAGPGADVETFAKDVPGPAGLAFDSEGNLFVVSSTEGSLLRIDSDGGVEIVAKRLATPSDVKAAPDGGIVVCNYGGTELTRFDAEGRMEIYTEVPEGTIAVAFDSDYNLHAANWDLQVLIKMTDHLTIPCPHCRRPIPVRIRPKKRTTPESDKDEVI